MALAGEEKAILHLLHVAPSRSTYAVWEAKKALEEWVGRIQQDHPNLSVKTHLLKGKAIQRLIIDCARMLEPDLILIGRKSDPRRWGFFRRVSPYVLARKTNCPVLTFKPGSMDSKTRIILLPIRDFLPERKLEWAILLARKYKAQVHLLAIRENRKDEEFPQVFLRVYHRLRESLFHPVEFSSTTRHDMAKATLSYAQLIMADMILVNPETESGIGGFTGVRHISDLLGRDSKIQVLDLEPYKIS